MTERCPLCGSAVDLETSSITGYMMSADVKRICELEQALKEKDTCARQCEGAAYRAEAKRLRALNTELIAAADALIKRWDSPSWKDVPPTRDAIERLRDAAEKAKEPPR